MSRDVEEQRCRGCRCEILVGMSDDYCAHEARVGRSPLNPFGEMLARLAGLYTYDLHRERDSFRLYERDRWQITGRPAGFLVYGWRADVLAEHRCGFLPPSTFSVFDIRTFVRPDPNGSPPF